MNKRIHYSKKNNKAICQRIRESIPIQDYAASRGFQIIKKGSFYAIKGESKNADFSSVMIKPSTNRYCHYACDNHWHSIIDFVMELDNCDEKTAIESLLSLIDTDDLKKAEICKNTAPRKDEQADIELCLPKRADTMKNVDDYLIKARCINRDIVDSFIYNGNLYQDKHNNCVFVSYDRQGNAKFCNKRSTNTASQKRFLQDVKGSDYEHCFFMNNGSDTLIVTESVIDSMSVMSIMQDCGKAINSYDYVALSGTGKWEAVLNILKENPNIKNVLLACDNDKWGFMAMDNIRNAISENFPDIKTKDFLPKTEHDWNDQLKFNRKNGISSIDYLKEMKGDIL